MPEGPTMLIARDDMSPAIGKKLLSVAGNSRQPIYLLKGATLKEIGTWGKHLLLVFTGGHTVKIHFLMFGSYSINKPKEGRQARLDLKFKNIRIYFYACAVSFLDEDIEDTYDWSADILSPAWSEQSAVRKILKRPRTMICDILMDQTIFSGVGNIIKNEVLFLQLLHPERKAESLTKAKILAVTRQAHDYSWKFYYWKKAFELKKHWLIMRKKKCPRCDGLVLHKPTGKGKRISHFCPRCQK